MSDLTQDAREQGIDALLKTFALLVKTSNRTTDKPKLEELKKSRRNVMRQLDRLEIAELNSLLLPEQVSDALNDLNKLTKTLQDETKKIAETAATITQVNEALTLANQTVASIGRFFVLV